MQKNKNVLCIPRSEYRGREKSRGTTSIYHYLTIAASECKHTLLDVTVEPVWPTQEIPSTNNSRNEFAEFTLPHRTNRGSLRVDMFGYWFPLKRLYVLNCSTIFKNVNRFIEKIFNVFMR